MLKRTSAQSWRSEGSALLRLAGPLIVNNLAVAGMNFADAVMAGRLGAKDLAAVAIGGSVWMIGFMFCMGLLMAISPIVAHRFGAGETATIGRYTRQGLLLGIGMGTVLALLVRQFAGPALVFIGIDTDFRDLAVGYVQAIMLGVPAICVYMALRFTTEGIGSTRPIMYVSLFALVANVFGNYVLMYGHFGAPALGAIGCGYASAITMWLMLLILAVYMYWHPRYQPLEIFTRVSPARWPILKEMLTLGLPISITVTAETGLFAAISLLMGTRSADVAAAHQIAINFASTLFMIPLALNSATTVRVGQALGNGMVAAARFRGWVGITLCGAFMLCSAAATLLMKNAVVSMYTNVPIVQQIAISLLFMAALFQVGDGVQIGAAGALRGFKDTRGPMLINTAVYWGLAFPLAYLAAIVYRLNPQFIWGGFVLGLSISAVLLTLRYAVVSKRAVASPLVA